MIFFSSRTSSSSDCNDKAAAANAKGVFVDSGSFISSARRRARVVVMRILPGDGWAPVPRVVGLLLFLAGVTAALVGFSSADVVAVFLGLSLMFGGFGICLSWS